jgi:hypothetical protein
MINDLGLFLPRPWLSVDPARVLCDAPVRGTPAYVRGRVTLAGREPVQLGYWRRIVLNAGTDAVASEQVTRPD